MCWLLYACNHDQVVRVLNNLGIFASCMTALVVIGVIAVTRAKAKRSGSDLNELDHLIERERRRAAEYDDQR